MKEITLEQLKAEIEAVENELSCTNYAVLGIRTQEEPFELGAMDHVSSVWVDSDETDELLDGVSATSTDSRFIASHTADWRQVRFSYFGEHTAIIAGDSYSCGEDEGEVVIENPVVVRVIR